MLHLYIIELKKDEKEALKYYQDVIIKKQIGKYHSLAYLTWVDIELKNGAPTNRAVEILNIAVAAKAQPAADINNALKKYSATTVSARAVDPTLSDEDNEEEDETVVLDAPIHLGAKAKSVDVEPVKPLKAVITRSTALGKCQRVVKKDVPEADDISDDESDVKTIKIDLSSAAPPASVSTAAKPNLTKFIDDNIKNFDPKTWRSKRTPATDAPTSAISSNVASRGADGAENAANKLAKKMKVEAPAEATDQQLGFDIFSTTIGQSQHPPLGQSQRPALGQSQPPTAATAKASKDTIVSTKRMQLSLSDDESNSIDISICDITKKLGPEDKENIIRKTTGVDAAASASKPDVKSSSKKRGTADTKSASTSNENSAMKKKRVSFSKTDAIEPVVVHHDNVSRSRNAPSDGGESISSIIQGGRFRFKDNDYSRLGVLGKGGSSTVYRVISQNDGNLYAYKKVDMKGDCNDVEALIDSYLNEIELLRRLKGSPYIIDIIDAEINREDMYIHMVMEVGDIDLAKTLMQKQQRGLNNNLNPFFVRLIWSDMLEAVDYIHQHRIVHGDLKPANFVFVKGHLKLIDFGIAKTISNDTTNIYRESQIGTVNYMAPEAISPSLGEGNSSNDKLKMKLGKASDIWSLGCILYQMVYGKPPFHALNTIQKLHAIPNPKHAIVYPEHVDTDAVSSIKLCLVRDPKKRASIRGNNGLLSQKFLSLQTSMASSTDTTASTSSGTSTSTKRSKSDTMNTSLSSVTSDGTTTEFDIPLVGLDEVKRAVDYIVSSTKQEGGALGSYDNMCRHVWSMLTHKAYTPAPSQAPAAQTVSKAASVQPAGANKFEMLNSIKTRANSLANNENVPPKGVNQSVLAAGKERKPLQALPSSLLQNIQSQSAALQSVENSNANKWIKPKAKSPENDIKSALERRFNNMRKFLDVEENNVDGDTFDLRF